MASSEREVVRDGESGGETRIDSGVEGGREWAVGVHPWARVRVTVSNRVRRVRRRFFIVWSNNEQKFETDGRKDSTD